MKDQELDYKVSKSMNNNSDEDNNRRKVEENKVIAPVPTGKLSQFYRQLPYRGDDLRNQQDDHMSEDYMVSDSLSK